MTVALVPGDIDLSAMGSVLPAEATPRGTWLAVGSAIALLLGRALLWLLVQLLKFLLLLAIVGTILAIGFQVGHHWDDLSGAAAPAVTELHHR